MAISNIWVFPIFISFYSIVTLLLCASLSAWYHHFPDHWPYLSDFTIYHPAKNVFSVMVNHIVFMAFVWMYIKHRNLLTSSREDGVKYGRVLGGFSYVLLAVGVFAAVSLQAAVNFPETKAPYIQFYGNRLCLLFGIIYLWSHAVLSAALITDEKLGKLAPFVARIGLASIVTSCTAAMVKELIQGTRLRESQAFPVYEWACYFSFCCFLLIDAFEFRNLILRAPKLVIRGAPNYDPSVFSTVPRMSSVAEDRLSLITSTYVM